MGSRLGLCFVLCALSGCDACGARITLPSHDAGRIDEDSGSSPGPRQDAGIEDAAADAGSDARIDDPTDVIDRGSLIPTSGAHVIFEQRDGSNGTQLFGIDVESGALHELAPDERVYSAVHVSPDHQTLIFSVDAGDGFKPLIAHALDDGLIPAGAIEGLPREEPSTTLWTADSRFAVIRDAVQVAVVDAYAHVLHGSLEAGLEGGTGIAVAPTGPWFAYAGVSTLEPEQRTGFGRITSEGVEWHDVPQPIATLALFSADGERAIYETLDADSWRPAHQRRELREGTTTPITPVGVPGLSLSSVESFLDADHVIARFATAEGILDTRTLDLIDGSSVEIGEPDRMHTQVVPFAGGDELLVTYGDDAVSRVVMHRLGRQPDARLEPSTSELTFILNVQAYGPRHVFFVEAVPVEAPEGENPEAYSTWLAGREDDGALESAMVLDAAVRGQPCAFGGDHGALHAAASQTVELLDLSAARARRAATLDGPHGGALSCPLWNLDGTAFAIVESADINSDAARYWLYLARWPEDSAAPSELELLYESGSELRATLADL